MERFKVLRKHSEWVLDLLGVKVTSILSHVHQGVSLSLPGTRCSDALPSAPTSPEATSKKANEKNRS